MDEKSIKDFGLQKKLQDLNSENQETTWPKQCEKCGG